MHLTEEPLLPTSCSDDDNVPPDVTKKNPTTFIKDAEKVAMLRSMKDVDGSGRLYEINYTADYKLDDVLKSGFTETNQLFNYVAYLLYDSLPRQKGTGFVRCRMQCLCSTRQAKR